MTTDGELGKRPNKKAILSTLKGFQQRTVEHIVRRLDNSSGSGRFLVADEVGLGKTLVARGVVAEFVDRAWEDVSRIDILYVCSNTSLANENLRKIHIGGSKIGATRLTLLPKELANFDPKLNFISFTPSTALQVTGYGRVEERVVLYTLLQREYGAAAWLKNLLQGDVETERWRTTRLQNLPALDESQWERFLTRLKQSSELQEALTWARETLVRTDSVLDDEQRRNRYHTVGKLRRLLAFSCIDALEPDLIILDEFQRFKDLLTNDDDARSELTDLADELLRYMTPQGKRVATLLLSATPYRMFATRDELESADHYTDFLDTLRFLCDNETTFANIKVCLDNYSRELRRAAHGEHNGVSIMRDALETCLKEVMVRTERVDSTAERDAMVAEPHIRVQITKRDLAHYVATEQIADQLDARDMVEFWKSAPYLFNFMKGYQVKNNFDAQLHIKAVRKIFEQAAHEFLSIEHIQCYNEIDPANGRLRALREAAMGSDQWKMLWLPPTFPYWPLSAPWSDNADFSKKLVFSAWNVVPDVVSALLSYEAERRMVSSSSPGKYSELYHQRRPLLRWALSEGRPVNMTTLALSLPCLALSDEISPLGLAIEGKDVRTAVQEQVQAMLDQLQPQTTGDQADPRWHWAVLLLLDDKNVDSLRLLLEKWDASDTTDEAYEDAQQAEVPETGTRGLRAHLEEALKVLNGEIQLGPKPDNLVETVTDLALGSPAILTARALNTKGAGAFARRRAGVRVANGFRKLFNQPPVMLMLRAGEDAESYWRATLQYAMRGNLQAVLDEQVHLLWEQAGWDNKAPDDVCLQVADTLRDSVTMKVSRVSPDIYTVGERRIQVDRSQDESGNSEQFSLRTSFALRYGSVTGTSGATEAREESVRSAFKSPFFPFVLVSTSIGQEGLDFHPWCHDIWHWNLPGNPVDLEQREGRVHRYKGLAIRRNVAQDAREVLRENWKPGLDPWEVLFCCAEKKYRSELHSELVPHWVAPGPHKVRRCIPALPYSSEIELLHWLKRSLAIYRVVFGQPRQEELLTLLEDSELTRDQLERWAVSLKPD